MMSPVPGDHRTSLTMVVLLCSAVVSSLLSLVCAQSDHCGISVAPLVTQGRPLSKGEYPWLAALYQVDEVGNWNQFCGGALLSPRIVLTAAHCLCFEGKVTKPGSLKVGLGKLYRDFYHNEDYAIFANVEQVVVHEGYYGSLSGYALDVGLLKLSISVKMTDYILPVCIDLDTTNTIHRGATVHAAGWGTCENGSSTERALAADLSYLDNHACLIQIREEYRKYVTYEKICSLSINGSQVDRGDSGGGLTFVKNGRHFVVGVVSSKIMGETTFSIFTDLSKTEINVWLKKKISNLNSPDFYGYLLISSSTSLYKVPVTSSMEFTVTTVSNDEMVWSPAVDCVTGIFYYYSLDDKIIKQGTVNAADIKNFTSVDGSSFITGMTVDWIGRNLYWLETSYTYHTNILKGANIDTMKIESIVPTRGKCLAVHPTLRKIYVLTDTKRIHSVDLDSSPPTITLFHEEVGDENIPKMAIDWETNDLCWLALRDKVALDIKCKNLVTKTLRTVLSDFRFPWVAKRFIISPHTYYWSDYQTIHALPKSLSRVENFTHTEHVRDLDFVPKTCPTLTPAPKLS